MRIPTMAAAFVVAAPLLALGSSLAGLSMGLAYRRMEESMLKLKLLAPLAVVAIFAGTMSVPASEARAAAAGHCGQYMYWQAGKCVDARSRAPQPWHEVMAKKSNW